MYTLLLGSLIIYLLEGGLELGRLLLLLNGSDYLLVGYIADLFYSCK